MSKKSVIILSLIAIVAAILIYFGIKIKPVESNIISDENKIRVIAAENFWGSLVLQIGGNRVNVASIVSDPNYDPHEYGSNANNARDFAIANYVIVNGAGYDSWADKLLGAGENPNRKVLNVADLIGKKDGDNPHFWYYPSVRWSLREVSALRHLI